MSPTPRPTPATPPVRRRRRIWIVLGAVLGLVLALWFLRARLLERVATSVARTRAGLDVRFEGLEIEGLSRLRASRVLVQARRADESLRSASIDGLEVEVDVRGLWSDHVVVQAVRARAASFVVDTRRRGDEVADEPAAPFGFPDAWPELEVGALDVDFQAPPGRARLRGASIALGARPGDGGLAILAESLEVSDGQRSVQGALELSAATMGTGLEISAARWDGVAEVRSARFTPATGGGFEARLDLATRIGSADVEARSDAREIRFRGALREIDLDALLRLFGVKTQDYGGTWSARGSCVLPLADPAAWTADVDVQAAAPRIAGLDADAIEGRFLATAEVYEARGVLLLAGANAATAELVRVPRDADLACEFLDRATIALEADLGDLQALLGDLWSMSPDAAPHRVRLRAELADRWLHVAQGRAEIGSSWIEIGPTRVPLGGGTPSGLFDPSTEIEIALRSSESSDLARLLLPADEAAALGLRGAVAASVRLRSAAHGVSARFDLRARDAAIRGIAIDELSARAGFEDGRLSVERLELKSGLTTVRASGDVDWKQRRFAGLDVAADVPDLRDLGRALAAGDGFPAGRGLLRARLEGPIVAPEGSLEVDVEDFALRGTDVAWARLRARGEAGAIVVDEFAVSLPLAGTITAGGRVAHAGGSRFDVELGRLDLVAREGSAVLTGPARIAIDSSTVRVDALSIAGGEGALRIASLRAALDDGTLCADVAVDDAHVGRVLRAFGVAVPSGLRLDGRATVALQGLASDELDGDLDVEMGIAVPDLREVDLPGGFRAAGSARARIALAGGWRAPRGSLALEAQDLDVRDSAGAARVLGARFETAARISDGVELERAVLVLSRGGLVEASGRVAWPLDFGRLARGDLGGLADSPLELSVRANAPDLAPLADAFEALRRTAGALTADFSVRGTASTPVLGGRVQLRAGGVKLSATLPSISDVEIDVVLEPERVTIERATGTYGGGQVDASGSVAIGGPEPVLELALRATSIPLLRSAEASLRSDVDVRLAGPWSALALSGTAGLRDARFEQRLDLDRLRSMFEAKPGSSGGNLLEVPALTEPPFDAMTLALDVRSEAPVRVRTPLLRAEVVTRFSIRGTGATPLLSGSLELEGGRMALPASKLDLTAGRVDFDPNDPGRARLDVNAEGRVSGYDVRARVTGTTDEPLIELTSIPPATQEDLALLLLAGRIPGSRGLGLDQDRVVGELASYVARDLAYEWFGDAGESFADRLEMATGADVTQSGSDTIEVRFRLVGPARGAGRAVYLRGERDVYDRVNMGVRFVLRKP